MATTVSRSNVTLVGAGISGLTAALHLSRRGFKITIFERSVEPNNAGTGIQLSPNAFKILADLGLASKLVETGFAPDKIDIRSGVSGKRLTEFTLGEHISNRHNAPYLVIHRASLSKLLLAACEAQSNIQFVLGAQIQSGRLEQKGVVLEYAIDGSLKSHRSEAVIGADGAFSSVRQLVPGNEAPGFTGRIAWRSVVPLRGLPNLISRKSTGLWLGPDAHLVHYPLHTPPGAETQLNVVAITPWKNCDSPPRGWISSKESQDFEDAFSTWLSELRNLINLDADWGGWPIYAHENALPSAFGPVCLIGDAAHPMVPYGAQGGACGIEDAAVLALECAASPDDLDGAFHRFQVSRRDRVQKIMDLSNNNRRIYHMGWPMSLARNTAMKIAPQAALQKRMDWLYGWSVE